MSKAFQIPISDMVALDSKDVLGRGDEAPSFELEGIDRETYTLGDFSDNEAILIVFTCNHCPYAKAKFEEMNRLSEEYDDVAVVGVNSNDETEYPDDDFETMIERVEDGTIQWDAYLRDDDQSVAAEYGAMCTPDPFLFENDGDSFKLVYHGRLDDALNPEEEPSTREMRDHIEDLLAGRSVDSEFKPSRGCSIKWRESNEPAYWET